MAGIQNESGVSVIVGTLLLILITVTASASLAIMVSQMQKDEMNRQSHLAAVKNENIEFLNIGLKNDREAWNRSPFNVEGKPVVEQLEFDHPHAVEPEYGRCQSYRYRDQ